MSPVTDFTKYQPPGVYVSEVFGGVAGGGFGQDVVVALVGEGLGTQAATDQLQLSGTDTADLTYYDIVGSVVGFGIETGLSYADGVAFDVTDATTARHVARKLTPVANELVWGLSGTLPAKLTNPFYVESGTVVVKNNGGTVTYEEGADHDYVIDYDSGTIARTSGSTIPSGLAEGSALKVSYSYCAIKSGHRVAFSYQYTPSGYSDLYLFTDFEDVARFYGQPLSSAGVVQSELSLGAYFAFRNGADAVYCVAVTPAGASIVIGDWETAVAKLEVPDDIDIIVPVSGDAAVHAVVEAHVNAMVASNMERRAIVGQDGAGSPVASASLISAASTIDNQRVALVSPSSIVYFNPQTNAEMVLGSQYFAAALAGVAAAQVPYMPLTMKTVSGFLKMNEARSKSVKNNEARGGLCVFEDVNGSIRIRHGLMTDPTSVHTREWSVVFAKDRMIQTLRSTYEDIIGQPILEDTTFIVKSLTVGALEQLKFSGYINDYSEAKVRQNTEDPTLIEVKFEYKPTYPLNYVYIQFAVDMTSGNIEIV
jgi:hypothetical protein